ncbi:hypothetical protein [Streptomyces mirabilis]|uniref:hypothetical protein n=1 Tax=Streptomyces mirabilis TaxID=68239 RepID=UPI003804CB12
MRRVLIPAAAVLLATACSSGAADRPQTSSRPSTPAATARTDAKGLTGGVPTPSGRAVLAISAAGLPYKPDAGMPALDDVKVIKTSSDPCAIPADDSGEEAQLLGAISGGPGTVNVTFSFTNPCSKPVAYDYKVTAAIGSAKGEQAGGGALGSTPTIPAGRTIKLTIPVDVSTELTPAQQKQLWVGVTEIGKQAE